jgi:mxaL protein
MKQPAPGAPMPHWQHALRGHADRALLLAAALLLAISLGGPGVPMQRALFDQIVVLDITQSMNVRDMQLEGRPASRLDFAKHALRQVLTEMPCGSKLGWGIFTEYRSLLLLAPVEVCANLGELRATLARIDGRMAWTGNSEITKGLYAGIGIAKQLAEHPGLVFVSDGQEAPPLNPRNRPAFGGRVGEVAGLVVGVGQLRPSPIPKTDPTGRPLGFWAADEVMQHDPRSQGRGGTGEAMVGEAVEGKASPGAGAGAAGEHLSALHEAHLRLLAADTGLAYHRLGAVAPLVAALTAPALARPVPARFDLAPLLAGLALLLLVMRHLPFLGLPLPSAP